MNTLSRILLTTSLLGIFQTMPFAETPDSKIQTTNLRITVRVFDYAKLTENSTKEMITEARLIFLKAGIETAWVNCRNQQRNEEDMRTCESPVGPTNVVLRILLDRIPQRSGLAETTLGYAVVQNVGGSFASIYLRRIEAIAQGSPATRGQILGHAAAHEIGHLLLGTIEHSPNGIMTANWKGKTLDSIAKRNMHFNPRQAEYMQKQVQERQRR